MAWRSSAARSSRAERSSPIAASFGLEHVFEA